MFSAGQVQSRYRIARALKSFWHTRRTALTSARCSSVIRKFIVLD